MFLCRWCRRNARPIACIIGCWSKRVRTLNSIHNWNKTGTGLCGLLFLPLVKFSTTQSDIIQLVPNLLACVACFPCRLWRCARHVRVTGVKVQRSRCVWLANNNHEQSWRFASVPHLHGLLLPSPVSSLPLAAYLLIRINPPQCAAAANRAVLMRQAAAGAFPSSCCQPEIDAQHGRSAQ